MSIRCFAAPEHSFDEVANFIRAAEISIEGCQFQISSPPIVEVFAEALRKKVRLSLLIGEYDIDSKKLHEQRELIGWLSQLGAEIRLAPQKHPNHFHARWLCADQNRILLHTFALTERAMPNTYPIQERTGNRDFGVVICNDETVLKAVSVTLENLTRISPGIPMPIALPLKNYTPPPIPSAGRLFEPLLVDYAVKSDFIWGTGRQGNYFSSQFELLESSQEDTLVYMQYFDFEEPESQRLVDILSQTSKSGHIVRFLTKRSSRGQELTSRFAELGIQHREHFTSLHAKMIIRPKTVILQTKDWMGQTVKDWADCGVILNNATVAHYFRTVFDYDWDSSAESPLSTNLQVEPGRAKYG